MKLYENKEQCCGCGACEAVCQAGAVSMVRDREGFAYPRTEMSLCVNCGRCRQVCPLKHRSRGAGGHKYYGARALDESVRHSSSSGGVFTVFARHMFSRGGAVFGAAYDENMRVVHCMAEDETQLERIRRTKYVQSDMGGIYGRIESLLKEGRSVLFSGTPCQAHGLRLFLEKPWENLVTLDLVCYGVPSPGIWQDYVAYLEHRHGGKMREFSFRDKRGGDHGRTRSYVIDGEEYAGPHGKDGYCLMYFRNYILRPSCHECPYCSVDRGSDITIGDFWGIEKVKPEMDDGMGTSLVILHTKKGERLWNQVRDQLTEFQCKKEDVLQPRLLTPTDRAKGRRWFMLMYRFLPFDFIVKAVDDIRSRRILG